MVNTQFRKFYRRSFARVRYFILVKDIGRCQQGGKRFPSQFHRSNFFLNFTKTDIHGLVHNEWSILSWFWPEFCDAFWVIIRDSLAFSIDVSKKKIPTISCSLSPGDYDRSHFSVQFGVVLKL